MSREIIYLPIGNTIHLVKGRTLPPQSPPPNPKRVIQCNGCGYTHKDNKCPACGRLYETKGRTLPPQSPANRNIR